MISLEHHVTGGEIGRKLAGDPEELFYALQALIEDAPDSLPEELAEYDSTAELPEFLRMLADKMEEAQDA